LFNKIVKPVKRQIAWEKWRDPFGSDIEAHELPNRTPIEEDDIDDLIAENEHGEDIDDLLDTEKEVKIAVMTTSMGMIPMMEHTRAGALFNFWTAHTNFRMTKTLFDIIEDTHGVESLDVMTSYRWRIAIGKAFKSHVVKQALTQNLSATPLVIEES